MRPSLMTLVNKENVKVKQRFSTQEQKVGPQWLQNKSLIQMKEYERLASDFFLNNFITGADEALILDYLWFPSFNCSHVAYVSENRM